MFKDQYPYLLFLAILQIINISFDFFLLKKGGKSSDSVPLNEEDAQVDIIQNEQDCQHTVHYHLQKSDHFPLTGKQNKKGRIRKQNKKAE